MPRYVRLQEKSAYRTDKATGSWNETDSTQGEHCMPGTLRPMPHVRITIDGKTALTVEQAATRYGLKPSSMSAALSRLAVEPDAELDGRKKLYLATRLDEIIKTRPGKGANLRSRPPAQPSREFGRREDAGIVD